MSCFKRKILFLLCGISSLALSNSSKACENELNPYFSLSIDGQVRDSSELQEAAQELISALEAFTELVESQHGEADEIAILENTVLQKAEMYSNRAEEWQLALETAHNLLKKKSKQQKTITLDESAEPGTGAILYKMDERIFVIDISSIDGESRYLRLHSPERFHITATEYKDAIRKPYLTIDQSLGTNLHFFLQDTKKERYIENLYTSLTKKTIPMLIKALDSLEERLQSPNDHSPVARSDLLEDLKILFGTE